MSYFLIVGLALLGLIFGSVVGFFNHQFLVRGWQKITPERLKSTNLRTLKQNVMIRYAIHFIIDVIALLLVAKWIPALLGTAAGMIIMQKILIVKYIKTDKEVRN